VRSTLLHIPHELLGLPVLGLGWLLVAWIIVSVALLAMLYKRQGWNQDTASYLPFMAIVAGAIVFLLPGLEEVTPAGVPLGLPIRGFGVMLMFAVIAGVGLAAYRAQQMGIDPELIYTLAFWMFVAGIAGARGFYIVQYWHQFQKDTLLGTLQALANVTNGGLVVYGSVLLSVPVGIWFIRSRHLPVLAIGDIIAPSMVVGLALGRIGCFLNGCCFGGVCTSELPALTFPAASPPYLQQMEEGWRSGIWLKAQPAAGGRGNAERVVVAYVLPDSPAASAGLKPGDIVATINGTDVTTLTQARDLLAQTRHTYELTRASGDILRWTSQTPPARSAPVHPAQLYSSIDAALLALLLWFFYPYRRRDGEVFALLITLHPLSRFLLEMIRSDEAGQFGTALTISQWFSIAIFLAACGLWACIERQPRGSALPLARNTTSP
jgi:phosphatidylglycerol:prolipoprotein diacylglycerol transferase